MIVGCIAKNEEPVIGRMLESVITHIAPHDIVVLDTGSTDRTVEIALGLGARVYQTKWEHDFAHCRNQLIAHCKNIASRGENWLLMLDADETVNAPIDETLLDASISAYMTNIRHGSLRFKRPQLLNLSHNPKYIMPVHEYLHVPSTLDYPDESFVINSPIGESADKRTVEATESRLARDCAALERWTSVHSGDPRGWYYLARTYWQQGRLDLALAAYDRRVGLSGWVQEDFGARLELARVLDQLGNPGCVAAYLLAWEFRSSRAEPLAYLEAFFRGRGETNLSQLFGDARMKIPFTSDSHMVEGWCYE